MSDQQTVGELFPGELQRCRDLLDQYKAIGPAGAFGHLMITGVIERAEAALASGDVVAIVRSYTEMKGCE